MEYNTFFGQLYKELETVANAEHTDIAMATLIFGDVVLSLGNDGTNGADLFICDTDDENYFFVFLICYKGEKTYFHYDDGKRSRITYGIFYGTEFKETYYINVPSLQEQISNFKKEYEGCYYTYGNDLFAFTDVYNKILIGKIRKNKLVDKNAESMKKLFLQYLVEKTTEITVGLRFRDINNFYRKSNYILQVNANSVEQIKGILSKVDKYRECDNIREILIGFAYLQYVYEFGRKVEFPLVPNFRLETPYTLEGFEEELKVLNECLNRDYTYVVKQIFTDIFNDVSCFTAIMNWIKDDIFFKEVLLTVALCKKEQKYYMKIIDSDYLIYKLMFHIGESILGKKVHDLSSAEMFYAGQTCSRLRLDVTYEDLIEARLIDNLLMNRLCIFKKDAVRRDELFDSVQVYYDSVRNVYEVGEVDEDK